ncbi:hypothetical protein [Pseudomonas sp. 22 E 5]|nr:hypothetical protein [Pseudomonas sp. 22 E 5]
MDQAQPAERRFQRACGTEGVTAHGLGRRTGYALRKQAGDGQAFHGVVVLGRGAVQVQVTDVFRFKFGTGQGLAHRLQRTFAGGLGRGDMVRIATGAAAEQGNRRRRFSHQEQHRRFADIDAVAVNRKRIATLAGDRFQRGKAVQRQLAQAVDATADHRITHTQVEQALGAHQRTGAGSASSRNHIGRAADVQPVGEKIRRCAEFLLLVVIVARELLPTQVMRDAATGFIDARGAGAQHNADPRGAVGVDRPAQLAFNLHGRFQQQLVIAAALRA